MTANLHKGLEEKIIETFKAQDSRFLHQGEPRLATCALKNYFIFNYYQKEKDQPEAVRKAFFFLSTVC